MSKDAAGNSVVEAAELLRVFGVLRGDGSRVATGATAASAVASSSTQHIFEATLELLKQQLKASQEREARLLLLLEQEQQSRREMEQRLLPLAREVPVSRSAGGDQEQEKEEPTHPLQTGQREVGKGFLAKLFWR